MQSNYKVGDKVMIKSWEELLKIGKECYADQSIYFEDMHGYFGRDDSYLCGNVFTIRSISTFGTFFVNAQTHAILFDAMVTPVTEEDKKPDLYTKNDIVSHPSHYTTGSIEVWDYINDQKLDYFLGNAVKYISRDGKKNKSKEIEDLEKAVAYLNKKISILKENV